MKKMKNLLWQIWRKMGLEKFSQLLQAVFSPKPKGMSWRTYFSLQLADVRYQPLIFPDGTVMEKRCSRTIVDSRDKLRCLQLPQDFTGKTFLDVGCAEGFFVREALKRGSVFARGCDMNGGRIDIARVMADVWGFKDRTEFLCANLLEIPSSWAADIITCLAVCHHLHGNRNHDTWKIISEPEKYAEEFKNMLGAVEKVASLTKEVTYWEYCYEYEKKPEEIDYALLGKIWEKYGVYRKVEFRGLSQRSTKKDRAIYHAYK